MLHCESIRKSYGDGPLRREVLIDVSLDCDAGDRIMLAGPSGSGKTTLLSIMGCLTAPCAGRIVFDGCEMNMRDGAMMRRFRGRRIGFVFQHANLLPFLSVQDNIHLVASNAGLSRDESRRRCVDLCERLGISHLVRQKASFLSGGERQRVSIARAVIHRPAMILADEPTAALDWETAKEVMRLMAEVASSNAIALLVVSHDLRLQGFFERHLRLERGRLREIDISGEGNDR